MLKSLNSTFFFQYNRLWKNVWFLSAVSNHRQMFRFFYLFHGFEARKMKQLAVCTQFDNKFDKIFANLANMKFQEKYHTVCEMEATMCPMLLHRPLSSSQPISGPFICPRSSANHNKELNLRFPCLIFLAISYKLLMPLIWFQVESKPIFYTTTTYFGSEMFWLL